jgi:hypothetical protein
MFRVPCVFQRCRKILFALALEFFLGGFEIGYAYGDFFPLPSEAILRFSHAHPFFESCSAPIDVRDWGVNGDTALQDCDSGVCEATSPACAGHIARVCEATSRWIRPAASCGLCTFPVATREQEACMAKIDLDSLSIEEVAALRDNATDKLMEKVAARRAELEAELEKLSQYDRPAKKSPAVAPVVKAKKSDEVAKKDEAKEPIAKAA